jgi:L-threonylcarbamoyladenylate synthase
VTARLAPGDLAAAAALLAAGGVLALPTDTVYGVGARVDRPEAVARLFRVKRRPSTVALPVLVASLEQLAQLQVTWTAKAVALADAFWPGPLTIVVPAPHPLAALVGATTDTVGVRQPADLVLRELLALSGPLAVTSANEHGSPPCHDADEVLAALGGAGGLDAVLDGGRRDGVVSSVVALEGDDWRVLREGAVSASELAAALA